MQSLGKIVQCASAVGKKMWCFVCFLFVRNAPTPEHCSLEGDSSNRHCVAVYWQISTRFSAVFQKHYIVLIFAAR